MHRTPPPRALRTSLLALAPVALVTAALSCGTSAPPAASPAPATSWSSPLPAVSYTASPPGACAPLDPAHDYDGDAYAFAKHEDAVADAIGKAFTDAGGGAPGAAAASDAFTARRDALARDYHALCAALPAHVGDAMMRTLQMKTGFAIHKVCSTLPKNVSDPSVRATLDHLCHEFRDTVGQP